MPKPSEHADGRLWIMSGDRSFLGRGRIRLLEEISRTGSISKAAKAMGMSYKAAWDAVDAMNNIARTPLVFRNTGGKGGGGTELTEEGRRVITVFEAAERAHRDFLATVSRDLMGDTDSLAVLGRFSLRTSARNHFSGKICGLVTGPVAAEVEILLSGGDRLTAGITSAVVAELHLEEGLEVFAIVNEQDIILCRADETLAVSARNRLSGVVERIAEGAVAAEAVIRLGGGAALTAVITAESVKSLQLAAGVPVVALFKASSVIVGV